MQWDESRMCRMTSNNEASVQVFVSSRDVQTSFDDHNNAIVILTYLFPNTKTALQQAEKALRND